MGLEARLAVGSDPLDAAIGGDALLKAALHQLGVTALLLHLSRVRVRVDLRTREGTTRAKALRRNNEWGRRLRRTPVGGGCGVGWVRAASSAVTPCARQ